MKMNFYFPKDCPLAPIYDVEGSVPRQGETVDVNTFEELHDNPERQYVKVREKRKWVVYEVIYSLRTWASDEKRKLDQNSEYYAEVYLKKGD